MLVLLGGIDSARKYHLNFPGFEESRGLYGTRRASCALRRRCRNILSRIQARVSKDIKTCQIYEVIICLCWIRAIVVNEKKKYRLWKICDNDCSWLLHRHLNWSERTGRRKNIYSHNYSSPEAICPYYDLWVTDHNCYPLDSNHALVYIVSVLILATTKRTQFHAVLRVTNFFFGNQLTFLRIFREYFTNIITFPHLPEIIYYKISLRCHKYASILKEGIHLRYYNKLIILTNWIIWFSLLLTTYLIKSISISCRDYLQHPTFSLNEIHVARTQLRLSRVYYPTRFADHIRLINYLIIR